MKVLLLKNIKNIGNIGDTKAVSDGYARNFLFPNKLAVIYSSDEEDSIQKKIKKGERVQESSRKDIEALSFKLNKTTLTFNPKTNDTGVLFASFKEHDIIEELKKKGIDLPKQTSFSGLPIKKTGVHRVEVRFPNNISSNITVSLK